MNDTRITPQKFADAFFENFDFLISTYNYVIHQQTSNHFIAEKGDIRINIELERGIWPSVSIELLGQTAEKVGNYNRIDLVRIVNCINPEADTKMKWYSSQNDLAGMVTHLKKYASLAQDFCNRILDGDISQWPEIETCLEELSRKFREDT